MLAAFLTDSVPFWIVVPSWFVAIFAVLWFVVRRPPHTLTVHFTPQKMTCPECGHTSDLLARNVARLDFPDFPVQREEA